MSVHDRSSLSDAEKLVYLQQAIKNGSAKNVIDGLSCSGEHYHEAIDCLQSRYNHPLLLVRPLRPSQLTLSPTTATVSSAHQNDTHCMYVPNSSQCPVMTNSPL